MADRDLVRKDRQSSPASSPRGTNYLLAIAINEYQHCSKLNNAVRDAEALIELLTTRYHFDPAHVTFIKDADATEKRIRRAFDRLIDIVTEQDNLIVYFSGHGRHHERRGGYWIPVEAGTSDDDWSDYISNDVIKSYLSKIKSFHTFLIADSCFSGSLFIDKSKEKFSGDRRDTEPSRWGLTSGKKEIVSDGRPGTHSPFATALLDVLRKSDQPPGVMRICDLVLEKVAANVAQTPMGSPLHVLGHQGGQMVLYFREDEKADWHATLQANTRQAYSNFYRKYPYSEYAKESLAKLESVEEKEIWDQVPKNREAALLRFISENPSSLYAREAEDLIAQLQIKSSQTEFVVSSHKMPSLIAIPDNMVFVEGGTFVQGNIFDDESLYYDMYLPHPVTIDSFLFAKFQLTFEEYDVFCRATRRLLPSDAKWGRGKNPVINVSWFDAIDYCNWKSTQEKLSPVYAVVGNVVKANWELNGYRLPTEAEWEFAARERGNKILFGNGENVADPKRINFDDLNGQVKNHSFFGKKRKKTVPVGSLNSPNILGLHDMSGNVWEWCWDWSSFYPDSPQVNPKGPENGTHRIVRGGALDCAPYMVSTFFRSFTTPEDFSYGIGFRVARNHPG